ncbi:membrane protein [Klebsiella pneumoniae]|nr:membrane protein [Klebsiella pneumoniae]
MESGINAGHIYSVMTYMWMFATSLDDAPQLLEKFSQLRDIGKRFRLTMRPLYQENHAELLPFVC